MSVEIEQHCVYEATVRIRRGEGWVVRDETQANAIDGRRLRLTALWQFSAEDRKQYEGERAMQLPEDLITSAFWIASGDLVDIVEASK